MIRRPPRSTLDRSSAASDVYKRQDINRADLSDFDVLIMPDGNYRFLSDKDGAEKFKDLSLIHISEPTRPY